MSRHLFHASSTSRLLDVYVEIVACTMSDRVFLSTGLPSSGPPGFKSSFMTVPSFMPGEAPPISLTACVTMSFNSSLLIIFTLAVYSSRSSTSFICFSCRSGRPAFSASSAAASEEDLRFLRRASSCKSVRIGEGPEAAWLVSEMMARMTFNLPCPSASCP
jgi:hypothetical protein